MDLHGADGLHGVTVSFGISCFWRSCRRLTCWTTCRQIPIFCSTTPPGYEQGYGTRLGVDHLGDSIQNKTVGGFPVAPHTRRPSMHMRRCRTGVRSFFNSDYLGNRDITRLKELVDRSTHHLYKWDTFLVMGAMVLEMVAFENVRITLRYVRVLRCVYNVSMRWRYLSSVYDEVAMLAAEIVPIYR